MPRDDSGADLFRLHPDTAVLIDEIRRDKYMQPGEMEWSDLHRRVSRIMESKAEQHALEHVISVIVESRDK